MKLNERLEPYNLYVVSKKLSHEDYFGIYISISGREHYLYGHRANAGLFDLLAKGVRVDDLRRWRPSNKDKAKADRLRHNVKHLLKRVDIYLDELYEDLVAFEQVA